MPAQFTVRQSQIQGAGLGVFATEEIPRRVKFGPYVGKTVPASHIDEDTNTSYMWEVSGIISSQSVVIFSKEFFNESIYMYMCN